jgi:shikimate dehydrogenase
MEDRRIVLTGYRGTGKSSIGKNLALLTGKKHIDIDKKIEETTGEEISYIFATKGEQKFREIEQKIIASIPPDAGIVSTGGGAILKSGNVDNLRKNSLIILLDSDVKVIRKRIAGSKRPSLTGVPPEDEITRVLSERLQAYRSSADLVIDTSNTSPKQAAEIIFSLLKNGFINRGNRDALISSISSKRVSNDEKSLLADIGSGKSGNVFLYGILGYPCMHSKSPAVYNQLFSRSGILGHYTWFEYKDLNEFFTLIPESGVRGISVTIPHKEAVIPYLDEIKHDAEV